MVERVPTGDDRQDNDPPDKDGETDVRGNRDDDFEKLVAFVVTVEDVSPVMPGSVAGSAAMVDLLFIPCTFLLSRFVPTSRNKMRA